jgi:UDP-N-acetylglucosamine 2-epimerase (non-hydrolysing)
MRLAKGARFVLTDSQEIQEETTALRVPCLTLLDKTARPITIAEGTNTLVGTDQSRIIGESFRIIDGFPKVGGTPDLWDGRAASRLVSRIASSKDRIRRLCLAAQESDPCMPPSAQLG